MSRSNLKKHYRLLFVLILFCSLLLSVQSASSAVAFPGFSASLHSANVFLESTSTDSSYPAPETLSPEIFYTPTRRTYPGAATLPPPPATIVPSASPTFQPSRTPSFVPPTQEGTLETESVSETPLGFTGYMTETATLIPLPELTLIFPQQNQSSLLITATPNAALESSSWATPQRIVPLALILLIWIILGSWFYFSQRNLND